MWTLCIEDLHEQGSDLRDGQSGPKRGIRGTRGTGTNGAPFEFSKWRHVEDLDDPPQNVSTSYKRIGDSPVWPLGEAGWNKQLKSGYNNTAVVPWNPRQPGMKIGPLWVRRFDKWGAKPVHKGKRPFVTFPDSWWNFNNTRTQQESKGTTMNT